MSETLPHLTPTKAPDKTLRESPESVVDAMSESDKRPLIEPNEHNQISEVYDRFLQKRGLTPRLFIILACCGIGLLSDTLEVMSISFAKDFIKKDFELTRQAESALSGVLFAGMLIGGLFWGSCADIYGRRKVLLISLTMNGIFAGLSSFATTNYLFLIARFFSGIGVGGSIPVIFSYVSEWVYSGVRGRIISAVATCWMVGTILAAALAWGILPESTEKLGTYWVPWRTYLLICSGPSLLAALLYCLLDESPIFLIGAGNKEQALGVLNRYGGGTDSAYGEIEELKRLIKDEGSINVGCDRYRVLHVLRELFVNVSCLFSSKLRKITFILFLIILPVHFGYYGFMLWLPEYLQQKNNNATTDSDYVYKESLYVAVSSLPGNLLTILLTDRLGPKYILVGSLVMSAGSVFLLWEYNTPELTVLLSCLFNGCSAPVFNMVDIVVPALYPTEYRTTAFGFHTSLIRVVMMLATWFFSLFIDKAPAVPILLTAVLLLASAAASLLLPPITVQH